MLTFFISFFSPVCCGFVFINVPRYKTTYLKKLTLEQAKQGTFVKLKIHQKEPLVLSAIRVEGDSEVRKPQTQQTRLQPI